MPPGRGAAERGAQDPPARAEDPPRRFTRHRTARLAVAALAAVVLVVGAAVLATLRSWQTQRDMLRDGLAAQVLFAGRQFAEHIRLRGATQLDASTPDSLAFRRVADDVLTTVELLPPTFGGVPWPVDTSAARGRYLTESGALAVPSPAALNALLAFDVTDCSGVVRYRHAAFDTPRFAESTVRGVFGSRGTHLCLDVHVRLDADVAAAIMARAMPTTGRWLLVGLLALAALLATSAALFLRQQQQLVQAQDEFVSAVSHELRTPLTQIRMFSETLLLDRAKSPEQAKRWIGVINRESERLGHLVESILRFARSERRELPLARDVTDIAQLARDVIMTFLPVAAAREVTIRTRLPAAALAFVDAGALRQMLLNLLDNAVKYGPAGQTITLELGSGARHAVEFRVDDQGSGVPAAERPRIWEPFERMNPGDGTVGGSGLGLSVVRTLAERHGGTAYVTDAPNGTGARFVIALPVGLTASDATSVEATRVTQEFAAADAFPLDKPLHADAWMHSEVEDIMWPPDPMPERTTGSFRVS